MRFRKISAIIICAALIAVTLAGCGGKDAEIEEPVPSETTQPPTAELVPAESPAAGETPHSHGIDYDGAFAAFPPDTVMISAGEYSVTWAELFFHLRSNINGLLQSFGEIDDWSEIVYNGMTFAEVAIQYASENALMYKGVEYGANLTGTTLSGEVTESIRADYVSATEQYGGEEEFLSVIWVMDGICSRDLFDYLVRTSYLANAVYTDMFGEYGELVTDEEAADFTAYDGYLMAKHILRLKAEEGDDNALDEATEVLELLGAYDGDDLESYFDELMNEYTEDIDGLAMFPNGYLFQYGDMVQEFFNACIAIEPGEFSGIVETTYGYHIILRLPLNFDEIPYYYYRQYDFTTLRNLAALGMFDVAMYEWMDAIAPEYTADYRSMDIAEIFKNCEH